jgi:hypothetical protein
MAPILLQTFLMGLFPARLNTALAYSTTLFIGRVAPSNATPEHYG